MNNKEITKFDKKNEEMKTHVKSIIEAIIFASYDPVSPAKIRNILKEDYAITNSEIKNIVEELKQEYNNKKHGIQIIEVAGGYHMRTKKKMSKWIELLLNKKKKETLSHAALETLSIIAYRQPITKAKIEEIRGVNVDGVLQKILQKGLVTILRKKDQPTVPYQYITTDKFLEYFGLKSLADLPKLTTKPEIR